MLETEATCPLCGDRRSSLFEARRFMDVEVRYRLCGRCGFVFQSPRMSGEALEGFYAHEYRLVYQDKAGPTEKDLLVQQKRAEHTIAFLSDRIDRVDRFLDIGSSAGILLEKMKGRFECLACGVEPGEAYRRFASDKGLEIYATLDELASAQTGPFDLVSMMHVLEHLADPVGYLGELKERFLGKGGLLLVEVPNLFAHESLEVAHLTAFSAKTLRNALSAARFRTVAVRIHGEPFSPVIPLYITILACPDEQTQGYSPERWVKLKRSAGMLTRRLMLRFFLRRAWRNIPDTQG